VFLSAVLEDALNVARSEYQHVAEVETDFPDVPPVPGYAGELSQVFVNLLVNAGHAIAERGPGEPGRIRISVREEGDAVVVRIGDNGCGISEDHRAKIFDQFFTTKKLGEGTGQGLALARSIVVNRHGGELSFTSEVGRGTEFCVRLPLDAPAPAGAEGSH
jgi:signal transduction histidine kinase